MSESKLRSQSEEYKSLDSACTSIRVMLVAPSNTAKGNQGKPL